MSRASDRRFVLDLHTEGNTEILNLAPHIEKHAAKLSGEGVLHLFVVGSTAALSTVEFEPGLVQHDVADAFQRIVPDNVEYRHELTWHDDNGHSHIRATLVGPSLTIPFANGKLLTGEYQQPVLIDFDTRPRKRKVIGTIL